MSSSVFRSGLTAVAVFALFALRASGAAAHPSSTPQPRDHGNLLVGTITAVDARAKSFVVRATDGKDTLLFWSSATGVTGGTLAGGVRVRVKWMKKQGKNWATSVEVIRQPVRPQGRPLSRRSPDPSTCDEFFAASKIVLPVHVAFMGPSLS